MKILIDIDALEKQGVVPPSLALTLRAHAIRETGSGAINMLLAFGSIAIAAGLFVFLASAGFAAFFGAGFVLLGGLIRKQYAAQWGKLGSIWMIIGALALSAAVAALVKQPAIGSLLAAVILTGCAVAAQSRLLTALVPLVLAAALGGSTGYWHACYEITVKEPTLTILLFSGMAYGAWQFAKTQAGSLQDLAVIFARVCVILINFGFWIGSLWGDTPGRIWSDPETIRQLRHAAGQQIPDTVFIVGWVVVLFAAGMWGAKQGRRFMVNTAATFGAIHFYTQWFEFMGMHPLSVIGAGLATIAIGLGFWRYNRKVLTVN